MVEHSAGKILQDAIANPELALLQEVSFGDAFGTYSHCQTHPYDIGEYLDPPVAEELACLERLTKLEVQSVLDVGAGSGRISRWLIEQGKDVVACETDPYCAKLCAENGVTRVHSGGVGDIHELFDACIVVGGGLPLRTASENPLTEAMEFLQLVRDKVNVGGLCLTDTCDYTHPLFRAVNGYKVAEIRFHLGSASSKLEHYVYPRYDQLNSIMIHLGFAEIYHIVKSYSAGDPVVYQHYSIWRRVNEAKQRDLLSQHALRRN